MWGVDPSQTVNTHPASLSLSCTKRGRDEKVTKLIHRDSDSLIGKEKLCSKVKQKK